MNQYVAILTRRFQLLKRAMLMGQLFADCRLVCNAWTKKNVRVLCFQGVLIWPVTFLSLKKGKTIEPSKTAVHLFNFIASWAIIGYIFSRGDVMPVMCCWYITYLCQPVSNNYAMLYLWNSAPKKNCCTIGPEKFFFFLNVVLFSHEMCKLSCVDGGFQLEIWNCHSSDWSYAGFSHDEFHWSSFIQVFNLKIRNCCECILRRVWERMEICFVYCFVNE